MMQNSVRFSHLMKCVLLSDLTEDQKVRFTDGCAVQFHKEQTEIFSQGVKPTGMVLIAHGMVEVSYIGDDGHKAILHHSRAGETLGEAEALGDLPCVATCIAEPNTTLLFCPTPLLYDHSRSPVFMRNLAKIFCSRLVNDNITKSIDQFLPVDQKIYKHLALLSKRKSIISQSQAYLADVVGCSRQTVNKTLGFLKDQRIIELRKGEIEVLDRQALKEYIPENNDRMN